MKVLNANAVIRYLLNDIEDQASAVADAIRNGSVMTTPEVIAEVVYVLSGYYDYSRNDVSWFIHSLLLDVQVDNNKALRYALGVFNQTNLDFVDCLMVAYHKVLGIDVFSFDKKLNSTLNKELHIYQIDNPPDDIDEAHLPE